MSKPRQAIDHPNFPPDDLDDLQAQYNALLAEQDGTSRGIFPIGAASVRYAEPCSERDRLACSVCLAWLFVPVRVVGCPHMFCAGCLLGHLARNQPACPQCNNAIEGKDGVKFLTHDEHFVVLDMLGEKKVKCRHELLGCAWQGHRNDLVGHLAEHCELDHCAHVGCKWRWKEDEGKAQHERECPLRSVSCWRECGWSGLPAQVEAHERECRVMLDERREAREARQGAYREAVEAKRVRGEEIEDAARNELEEAERMLEVQAVEEQHNGQAEPALVVKVSGHEFHVAVSTIERHPGSTLHKLLQSSRGAGDEVRLPHRNLWAFEKCVSWMQTSMLPDSFTCEELGLLRAEARSLSLRGLDEDLCSRRGLLGDTFPRVVNRLDLHGLDLRDYDLSGRVLVDCCLIGADLRGVSLAGSTLTECDFRRARLQGATLNGCNVSKCRFDFAEMEVAAMRELQDGASASFRGSKLQGCDLSRSPGLDLSTATLSPGAVLEGSDLNGVRLPCNVEGVSFAGSDLSGNESFAACTVTGANLSRSVLPAQLPMAFEECDLQGADMTRCDDFDSFSFGESNLNGAEFGSGSSFDGADFARAQVGARIQNSDLRSASFVGASLSGVRLERVQMDWEKVVAEMGAEGAVPQMRGATLAGEDLAGAVLTGADLSNADLSNATLSDAQLANVDLSNANLSNADVSNTDLSSTTLTGCALEGANASGCGLSGRNLSGCSLQNADLSNADLSNADLFNADLSNADLSNADLSNANLSNADLYNANQADCILTGVTSHVKPHVPDNSLDSNHSGNYMNIDGSTARKGSNKKWSTVLGMQGYSEGIHSFRVQCIRSSSPGHIAVGVVQRGVELDCIIGSSPNAWGIQNSPYKRHSSARSDYGVAWSTNSIVTVTLNFYAHIISFAVDGEDQGVAFADLSGTVYPALAMRSPNDALELLAD